MININNEKFNQNISRVKFFSTEMITNLKMERKISSLEEKYVRVYKRLEAAEKCETCLNKINKGELLLVFIFQVQSMCYEKQH